MSDALLSEGCFVTFSIDSMNEREMIFSSTNKQETTHLLNKQLLQLQQALCSTVASERLSSLTSLRLKGKIDGALSYTYNNVH